MLCYITVIRCLMSNIKHLLTVIWCHTSTNSYMTSDVSCHITVIRRLMLYVMLYNCYQTSDVSYQTSDNTHDVRHLITVIWCQLSKVRRLIWDICCHITAIRRLMLYVMLYNCYQTSDVSYQTSYTSYIMSDIW